MAASIVSRWILFAVSLVVLAAGCSGPKTLLITDPYSGYVSGTDSVVNRRVAAALREFSGPVRIYELPVPGDPVAAVNDAVSRSSERIVILSPLFLKQAPLLASDFPDKTFIVAGAYNSPVISGIVEEAPGNLIIAAFDRETAFAKAGELYARKIASAREKFSGSEISAAAIFYTGNFSRKREMNAFIDGYRNGGNPVPLAAETVSTLNRIEEVNSIIDRISAGDVRFMFLSAASLNAHAMSLLMNRSINLAGENIRGLSDSDETILFSIEDDVIAAIKKGYTAFAAGERGLVKAESTVLELPGNPVLPPNGSGPAPRNPRD